MRRQLRFVDVFCLGINGIVGSGIFLIPGRLLGEGGPASLLLFPVCGLLFIIVSLCFAEAASRVDRNGGPYNYVRIAFGDTAGFAVGWIAVVTAIFSYAAVANGLPKYLGTLMPGAGDGWVAHAISGVIIATLAWLNIRGIRPGARVMDVFTVGKLVPLLVLIGFGCFMAEPAAAMTPFAPHGFQPMLGLLLAVAFTYQGFEAVPVPAGETVDAKRFIPRAVIGSLTVAMVLYTIIHLMLVRIGGPVAGSEQPLADAAAYLMGPWGVTLISIGAVISMSGFCAGAALLSPRYFTVLCEDRFLPTVGARAHPRFGTPHVAIICISALTFLLTLLLDFDRLVDIAALAVVSQYFLTCLSIPWLRKKIPDEATTYRMPGGWLFPILGVCVSCLFIIQIRASELIWSLITVLAGFLVSWSYRLVKRQWS